MLKIASIYFIILCATLANSGLAVDSVSQIDQNRITPTDDGTIQLKSLGNNIVMASGIDNSGSYLFDNYSQDASFGYLLFDISHLSQVTDQNLAFLKIKVDNSSRISSDLVILSDRVLSIKDGTLPSGFFIPASLSSDIHQGSGFVMFNLTKEIGTLQQYDQNTLAIFVHGYNVTMGTTMSGNPAEIIVL